MRSFLQQGTANAINPLSLAEEYGEYHLAIYGLIGGMAVVAFGLL